MRRLVLKSLLWLLLFIPNSLSGEEQDSLGAVQRRGKCRGAPRGTRQTFFTEDVWKVTVSAGRKGTYHEIEQALELALAEVRHRIANNVQLF